MTERFTRRHVLGTFAATAATIAIRPAGAANLPLNVGVFATEGAAEVFYASELGYFKDAGIDITMTSIPSASAIAAAVSSGTLDIGYGSAVPLAAAYARGIAFRIISPAVAYAGVAPTMAIAVAKQSSAQKAVDLNGATIGVNGIRELSDLAALAWIDKNGGDLKSVKVAEIPFSEMAASLTSGRIAAAAMSEPYISSARSDLRFIGNPLQSVGPNFTMTVYFSADAWLQKNADAAKRFQAVIRRTAIWANSHPRESAALLARYTKLTPDDLATMARAHFDETLPDASRLQPVLDVAVKYGGFPAVKADNIIWNGPG